jgi:hypothetical protein
VLRVVELQVTDRSERIRPRASGAVLHARRHVEAHQSNALRTNVFVTFTGVCSAIILLAGSVAAQGRSPQSLQPDLFVTIAMDRNTPVAHGNVMLLPSPNRHAAFIRGNSGARTAPGDVNALTLNTNLYVVGSTVTPTTSEPEAEEEIAADPSDSAGNNLVAAISDFSSPTGFNFTK